MRGRERKSRAKRRRKEGEKGRRRWKRRRRYEVEEEERKKRMKDVSGGSPAPLGRAVEGGELDEHGEDEGRCGAH